jgi:ABC-type nitrate/sulfonate/bicarbonate transport system permease component
MGSGSRQRRRAWSDGLPSSERVYRRLREMILDGELPPQTRLVETQLAEQFEVSRTPVREALKRLAAEQLVLLTAPSLVFAPIFFSIFGLGRASIIGVIVMYATFIIIINTATAIRSVPVALSEMGRSFCASDWQVFRRIVIPAAMPLIMAGLRLGMGRAVKGMINGQMFIAAVGLGALVMDAGRRFDAETILAVLLVIIAVAVAIMKLVQLVDRRVTAWLPSTSRR